MGHCSSTAQLASEPGSGVLQPRMCLLHQFVIPSDPKQCERTAADTGHRTQYSQQMRHSLPRGLASVGHKSWDAVLSGSQPTSALQAATGARLAFCAAELLAAAQTWSSIRARLLRRPRKPRMLHQHIISEGVIWALTFVLAAGCYWSMAGLLCSRAAGGYPGVHPASGQESAS